MGIVSVGSAATYSRRTFADAAPVAPPPTSLVVSRPEVPKVAIPPPTSRLSALHALMTSPAWSAANADQRRTLVTLLNRVGPDRVDLWSNSQGSTPYSNGYDALIRLFAIRAGDTPILLLADHEGRTIADRLSSLTIDPRVLTAIAPLRAEEVIANVLLEIADPGRIDQGYVGTCAPTTLQYQLATYEPAEYVRLNTGLLSAAASVRMRGGNTLTRDDNSIGASKSDPRTPTERIFQNALMQASLPPNQDYVSDEHGEGVPAGGSDAKVDVTIHSPGTTRYLVTWR